MKLLPLSPPIDEHAAVLLLTEVELATLKVVVDNAMGFSFTSLDNASNVVKFNNLLNNDGV